LLEQVEPAFDDVAAVVVDRVEGRWATAAGTAAFAVPDLACAEVSRLRADVLGAAMSEDWRGG
jgi:hypothetical protein